MTQHTPHPRGDFNKTNAALNVGRRARFIRWVNTRDGWYPEIIEGRYQGRGNGYWRVQIDGIDEQLQDGTWAVYRP